VSKKSNRSKLYLEAASSAGGSSRSELPSKEAAFTVAETSIRQLMAKGRHKSALDRAKELHKAQGTAASEALLLGAYRVRIQDLMQQNLTAEATALLDLVRERHPAAVDRLAGVAAAASARTGQLEELVSPLNDPSLCTEHRLTIERAIQEQVSDLAALAECPALPSEHPLRKGAAALRQALEAVTSGPVGEEALALPEVSRRSPLASWKMLVRAIAAFYRREDETCRRYLGAIQPEAAAARLVPALQAMLDGTPGTTKPAPSAELVSRISSDVLALRHAIDDLDQAFESAEDDRHILDAIRVAVQACRRSAPGQVERLKQHISVRAAIEQLDIDKTRGAMGGPAHHDAYFYRLFAHSREQDAVDAVELLAACLTWNEFRLKAVEEGWFSPNGMAVATLYLHMAKLLGDIPEDLIRSFEQTHRTSKGASSEDLFFLHPDELYERACILDPHSEAFSQWMGWAKGKSRTRQSESQKRGTRSVRKISSRYFTS
jgi:hypothetical protein